MLIRIRDRVAFLTPGSGMGKKSSYGSGIRDEHPGSYFREIRNHFLGLKIHKFVDADPDPGTGIYLTLDPGSGMENSDPGYTRIIMGVP
jgi:hypothetical protein